MFCSLCIDNVTTCIHAPGLLCRKQSKEHWSISNKDINHIESGIYFSFGDNNFVHTQFHAHGIVCAKKRPKACFFQLLSNYLILYEIILLH